MGADSNISWTHHTFNPWWGCVKVSPACDHCYAESFARRVGYMEGASQFPIWGKGTRRRNWDRASKHWMEPFHWDRAAAKAGVRRRVFCGSMCDVMEENAPLKNYLNEWRDWLYEVIENTPHLDWLLLTKRPQNFRRYLPAKWLESPRPNVWGMTTVESPDYLWRLEELRLTPFAIRGVSMEPLLDRIQAPDLTGIDLVIVGGESGGGARPMHPAWVKHLLRQTRDFPGCAFHFKQWGCWKPVASYYSDDQVRDDALQGPHVLLTPSGYQWDEDHDGQPPPGTWVMQRMKKERAGRELAGQTWDEMPEVKTV